MKFKECGNIGSCSSSAKGSKGSQIKEMTSLTQVSNYFQSKGDEPSSLSLTTSGVSASVYTKTKSGRYGLDLGKSQSTGKAGYDDQGNKLSAMENTVRKMSDWGVTSIAVDGAGLYVRNKEGHFLKNDKNQNYYSKRGEKLAEVLKTYGYRPIINLGNDKQYWSK